MEIQSNGQSHQMVLLCTLFLCVCVWVWPRSVLWRDLEGFDCRMRALGWFGVVCSLPSSLLVQCRPWGWALLGWSLLHWPNSQMEPPPCHFTFHHLKIKNKWNSLYTENHSFWITDFFPMGAPICTQEDVKKRLGLPSCPRRQGAYLAS